MKRAARASLTVVLLAGLLTASPGVAREVVEAPRTQADRRPATPAMVEPGFPIDYVGVLWEATPDASEHHGEHSSHPEVRLKHHSGWGSWIPLVEDGAQVEGQWASGLIGADKAIAYQVRGLPSTAMKPRVVALNTTDGPLVPVGVRRAGSAHAISDCLSRADWGADASLRFDSDGETWPPEFFGVQVMTVHHTATDNDDPDPAATVRAIYRYHAVDRGWGDIGYHYLIDEQGRTYEGRWSGSESKSCLNEGGDGKDFAHDSTADGALMVTGAHTGGYNSGNLGVALLGTFTDHPRFGGEPKADAVDALERDLAELSIRHDIDPQAIVTYENPHPSSDATKTVHTISGHRDWVSTECPGERLYEDLPEIRERVAALMSGSDPPPPSDDTMHVGDLDGDATNEGRTWTAAVTILVVDGAGQAVSGVEVTGSWSSGASGSTSCITGISGTCSVSESQIQKRIASVDFTVENLSGSLTYDSSQNADPDGDSNGTSITVAKP